MKTLGYIGAFLGGAIAGTALGLIFAPEKGEDTRSKIAGAVDDFCKKHDIKLSRKDVDDLVDGQLIEVLKHYIGLQSEFLKLDIVDKVVRLLTVITMTVVLLGLLTLTLIYLSFGAAFALADLIGSLTFGFCIVAAVYLFILILFVIFRHKWIERPLVRFLASLLMEK